MAFIHSNSGKVAYGIKKFIIDSASEISTLPTNITVGSTAFVTEDSTTYMLNNQKQWIKISVASGGSGGGEGITDTVLDGGLIVAPAE